MKINSIGVDYSVKKHSKAMSKISKTETGSIPSGMSVICFKGGNKGDVLHVAAEAKPFFQKGGVATVINDYLSLNNLSATEKGRAVVVLPYHNGKITYAEPNNLSADLMKQSVDIPRVPQGLPDGHPLKGKEGQPLFVKPDLTYNKLEDVLKSGKDYWLLEEVASKNMSWGLQENAPIKLLKVVSDSSGKPMKQDFFMVFTEATAFYPEPYANGQYSSNVKEIVNSWGGDPYAKYNKAVVEFMEDISRKLPGFDPASVVCSDSQAAYVTHNMARKNSEGVEYFKGKKPIQIGHNLGDGYIGRTSLRNMIVNLDILTPSEWREVLKSPELAEALAEGGAKEEEFFSKFLPNMSAKNKLSAMSIATHYGNKGYLPRWNVVSQGYLDEIVKNREVTPFLYEDLKDLYAKGVLVGRTNPLNVKNGAFTFLGMKGFEEPLTIKLKNGQEEVIEPMKLFTEADRANITLEDVKSQKRANKINFLNRYLEKYNGAQLFDKKTQTWGKAGSASSYMRGKDLPLVTEIDLAKYINKLEKGENVNVIVSWGRGDFQKAFDEVLEGFKKYVLKTGDKNALLILGGDLNNDKLEGQKVRDIAELLSKDDIFRGRVMLMDGFAPGRPMAHMADCAIFPSRTAPCELTDLESKQNLCTPIVANGQGLGQKNFDPAILEEKEIADAFKTKHQYFDSREEMLKSADEDTRNAFNKVYNKIKSRIEKKFSLNVKTPLTDEMLENYLLADSEYKEALRKLRDSVMTDDIANCLNRCLNVHNNDGIAQLILQNQANGKYGWEENQRITRALMSTGEAYRADFAMPAKDISKRDVIGGELELGNIISTASKKPMKHKGGGADRSLWGKIKGFAKTKTGITALAGVAIASVGYYGYKSGWFSPSSLQQCPEEKHISAVV